MSRHAVSAGIRRLDRQGEVPPGERFTGASVPVGDLSPSFPGRLRSVCGLPQPSFGVVAVGLHQVISKNSSI